MKGGYGFCRSDVSAKGVRCSQPVLRTTDSYLISYTEARFVRRDSIRDVLLYKKECKKVRDVTAHPTENLCRHMEFVLNASLAENTGRITWPF